MSQSACRRSSRRTCCMCRATDDKRALARMVNVSGELVWDVHQRLPGRGGYVHLDAGCVSKMGDQARWERVLRLSPGTLRREQLAGVVRQVMAQVEV